MKQISLGRGNDHLNPKIYDALQMEAVAASAFGELEHINPEEYSAEKMRLISIGRGNSSIYGNVDDLNPAEYSLEQMLIISESRGSGKGHEYTEYVKATKHEEKK